VRVCVCVCVCVCMLPCWPGLGLLGSLQCSMETGSARVRVRVCVCVCVCLLPCWPGLGLLGSLQCSMETGSVCVCVHVWLCLAELKCIFGARVLLSQSVQALSSRYCESGQPFQNRSFFWCPYVYTSMHTHLMHSREAMYGTRRVFWCPYVYTSMHTHSMHTIWEAVYIVRVGQNRIYTLYMTVYIMISLPDKPYVHHIYYIYIWCTYTIYMYIYGLGQPFL
jgi:hypothetical protein